LFDEATDLSRAQHRMHAAGRCSDVTRTWTRTPSQIYTTVTISRHDFFLFHHSSEGSRAAADAHWARWHWAKVVFTVGHTGGVANLARRGQAPGAEGPWGLESGGVRETRSPHGVVSRSSSRAPEPGRQLLPERASCTRRSPRDIISRLGLQVRTPVRAPPGARQPPLPLQRCHSDALCRGPSFPGFTEPGCQLSDRASRTLCVTHTPPSAIRACHPSPHRPLHSIPSCPPHTPRLWPAVLRPAATMPRLHTRLSPIAHTPAALPEQPMRRRGRAEGGLPAAAAAASK
jgi:hypothetical protein